MLLFIYVKITTKQQYSNEGHNVQHHRERDLRYLLCALRNMSLKVAYQLTKANQILKEYNSYSVQYDTTSTYNQIKIYDKMKELEDSLYGMDYSIFAK